jgi:hypothetical protein
VGRARKNAGLDRGASLVKSEGWLAAALDLRLAVRDGGDVVEEESAFARDVTFLQALAREPRLFWRSWRVLAARRAIDTFEQVSRLGRVASRRTRRTPLAGHVRGLLEKLQGHLVVFLVEDELVAGHLGRVVRTGQTRAHWELWRRLAERRLDEDFAARAARSRQVLAEEGRRHLALLGQVQRRAGILGVGASKRVERLVVGLVARTTALGKHLGAEAAGSGGPERARGLDAAMERWCAERGLQPLASAQGGEPVESSRWRASFLAELDELRRGLAQVVDAQARSERERQEARELMTRVRHVQIDLGGASYMIAMRTRHVGEVAMQLVREYGAHRAKLAREWEGPVLSAIDELAASLPCWCDALASELTPQGTHAAAGRKASPALAGRVIAMLGEGDGLSLEEMVDVVEYGSAGDREGRIGQLRDAGRAMLRRRRRQGLMARGRPGRPRVQ